MSDEIKEILEFKENADYKRLSIDEIKCLDDYITNLQKENERLKELINQYEEEHTTTFEEWKRDIRAFEELENWLEEQEILYNKQKHPVYLFSSNTIRSVKNKIKELRGSDKE